MKTVKVQRGRRHRCCLVLISEDILRTANLDFYPRESEGYVFTGVGLCVCVSVCDHDN